MAQTLAAPPVRSQPDKVDERRRSRLGVAGLAGLTVVVCLLWPLAWVRTNGGMTALIGAGVDGPSRPLVQREVPGAVAFAGLGHDGQQFYAIARHPLNPAAGRPFLDAPAYRYRRILFPALAGALAPHGGRRLVFAFLGVSLLGVALGAWALQRLPGGPWWLPLTLVANPGVGVAVCLSLADALGTGLVLAAFAASVRRRWGFMLLALVAASLTRETLVIAALALTLTPSLPRRWRPIIATAPILALGAWSTWSALIMHVAPLRGADQLTYPLVGWLQAGGSTTALMLGLGSTVVLGLAARRARPDEPHVRTVLGATAALMLCLGPAVTTSWINTTRVSAPVLGLALWVLVRRESPSRSPSVASLPPFARADGLPPPAAST